MCAGVLRINTRRGLRLLTYIDTYISRLISKSSQLAVTNIYCFSSTNVYEKNNNNNNLLIINYSIHT